MASVAQQQLDELHEGDSISNTRSRVVHPASWRSAGQDETPALALWAPAFVVVEQLFLEQKGRGSDPSAGFLLDCGAADVASVPTWAALDPSSAAKAWTERILMTGGSDVRFKPLPRQNESLAVLQIRTLHVRVRLLNV